LLGLVGLRGVLVPAYDLRALLGYPNVIALRWLVVAADTPVVLGFEQFDGHLRVPCGAITAAVAGPTDRLRCVRQIVHTNDGVRPLIHVASVLETLAVLARRAERPKE
jgi:chemotaxis signal transduction protein